VDRCERTRQSFNGCKSQWRQTDKDFDGFKDLEQNFEQASRSLKIQLQQASTVVEAVHAMRPLKGTNANLSAPDTGNNSDNANAERTSDHASATQKSAPDLDTSIKKLIALNDWFKQEDNKTAYAAEIPQLIANLKKEASDQRENRAALQNAISKQFASLNSALASKRWGPARSIHERLSNKISRLPEADKPRHQEKLSRLEVKLNELGDWKQFATEPKLISLCEQMEKIPEHGLAPRDQADRIKALQQQWKSMGASPALEQHWPRFKTAADKAYEPCAKYFAEKRKEKNSKLKHRTDVCEMLESYLEKSDWEKAEWKLVAMMPEHRKKLI